MLLTRLGIVFLMSALFAGSFAGIVRLSGLDRYDAVCRVSSNPACFGPNLR
ncbi:hypothetical protein [Pseudaminobacter sp. NGMCC 1.201702]|uniref:hypothetical protein n=1 Tax=Pseudaminobacter sp. NGMCC 1.201702 TaxID=3391825 RepID=UPI0039F138A6